MRLQTGAPVQTIKADEDFDLIWQTSEISLTHFVASVGSISCFFSRFRLVLTKPKKQLQQAKGRQRQKAGNVCEPS